MNECVMKTTAFLLLTLAGLAPGGAWAINKCTDAAGKVSYQEQPCPASARQSEVAAPRTPAAPPSAARQPGKGAAAPAGGGPAAGDTSADKAILRLVSMDSMIESCQHVPDFQKKGLPLYQKWRQNNQQAYAQYENSGRYAELMARAREQALNIAQAAQQQLAAFCSVSAIQALRQQAGQ